MGTIVEVLGVQVSVPPEEAERFLRRIEDAVRTAAAVPALLAQLDDVHRRHERAERQLAAIRASAESASQILNEELATGAR